MPEWAHKTCIDPKVSAIYMRMVLRSASGDSTRTKSASGVSAYKAGLIVLLEAFREEFIGYKVVSENTAVGQRANLVVSTYAF